jgi:PhnB protein
MLAVEHSMCRFLTDKLTLWGRHAHIGSAPPAPNFLTRGCRRLAPTLRLIRTSADLHGLYGEPVRIGHAEIRVGDTVLLAFDRRPDWPVMPSLLRVFVADADATIERAATAGARVITAPATQAFGQRGGRVRDPFGNIWWISTVVEVVTPEVGLRRLAQPEYAEAMRDAQETLDRELSGKTNGFVGRPLTG